MREAPPSNPPGEARVPTLDALEHVPSAALSAYLEGLVQGRRVAVLGPATSGFAERVLSRGARLVHAYDIEPLRVSEAVARTAAALGRRVAYALYDAELGVRDGAFDIVAITDLSMFSDAGAVMAQVRRLLAPGGVSVVACPNPGARVVLSERSRVSTVDYYELYDVVSLHFEEVRMLGQAPLVGYTIADFAPDGEPEVTVDTSLVEPPPEPEWFVAVGSDRRHEIDAYALVAVPPEAILYAHAVAAGVEPTTLRRHRGADRPADGPDPAELASAKTQLAMVSAELDKQREAERDAQRELTTKEKRIADLKVTLEERDVRLRAAEARVDEERARAKVLSDDLERMEGDLQRAEQRVQELEGGISAAGTSSIPAADEDDIEPTTGVHAADRYTLIYEEDRAVTQVPPPPDSIPMVAPPQFDSVIPSVEEFEDRIDALSDERDHLVETCDKLRADLREASERASRLERSRNAADKRAKALEADLASARKQLDETAAKAERSAKSAAEDLAAEQNTTATLQRELRDTRKELAALRKAAAQPVDDSPQNREIDRLEQVLRERGKEVRRLASLLRESERTGRELLEDLLEAREQLGVTPPEPPAGGTADDGQSGSEDRTDEAAASAAPFDASASPEEQRRLDALAEVAAKAEADLVAASWKISELERRLATAETPTSDDEVRAKLESALVAAHREIDTLRLALPEEKVAGASTAQSVLLDQVAGELEQHRRATE